jgi:sugar lactone lactonase YvrE
MSAPTFDVVYHQRMTVGECPLWHHGEQRLYWVDIDACTVHTVRPGSGEHQAWVLPSEPSALAMHAQGGLAVATRQGVLHLDTASGATQLIAAAPYDTATMRFNDGRVDPAGRFWIGTLYEPRNAQAAEMYCLERGQLKRVWSGGMMNSNGLGFAPDGRHMYHADTAAHRINRYPFDAASGQLGQAESFQQFDTDKSAPGYGGRPDGAAVDSEGAYWCAMFEGARLLRLAPDGALLQELALPVRCPTMLAFGGPDLKTLYITSAGNGRPVAELERYPLSGQVLATRVEVAGRPEPMYQP